MITYIRVSFNLLIYLLIYWSRLIYFGYLGSEQYRDFLPLM